MSTARKLSRDETTRQLRGCKDGTYLVRESSTRVGEYTLTVRCDGDTRLVRILQENGKFCFSSPFEFGSVLELVNAYKTISLAKYNPKLDVTLQYPAQKESEELAICFRNETDALKKLLTLHNEFINCTATVDNIESLAKEEDSNLERKKQAVSAFEQTIALFQNQSDQLAATFKNHRRPMSDNDLNNFRDSFSLIESKVNAFKKLKQDLQDQVHLTQDKQAEQLDEIGELKNSLHNIIIKRQKCEDWLKNHNFCSQAELDSLLYHFKLNRNSIRVKGSSIGRRNDASSSKNIELEREIEKCISETLKRFLRNREMKEPNTIYEMHADDEEIRWRDEFWYAGNIDRSEAEKLLRHRKCGTFLIREKDENFVLSVLYKNNKTGINMCGHAIITSFDNLYVGFQYPFNFPNLNDLVDYYRVHSLKKNNSDLDVKLEYPYRL